MTANNYGIKFVASSSDRIDFGSTAKGTTIKDLTTFTLEAWMKVGANATNSNARAYLERQGSGKNPRLALTGYNNTTKGKGILRFEFSRRDNKADTDYIYQLPDGLWDDYWHHVAFAVDVGEKEYDIFLDFSRVATGKVPDGGKDGSDNPLHVANTTPLDIILGAFYNGSSYTYWDGKLDNIRLWSSRKSGSSLASASHDHIATPGSESGLIEEWRLNEGTGTSTVGAKNATWTSTLKRAGVASSALWNSDRPFMGDGSDDETAPSSPTMTAPTSITSDGFTINYTESTDNVYVQYYEVTIATDNAFTSPVGVYTAYNNGLNLTLAITGLTPATNYYARVRALDAALNGSDFSSYNSNAAITTLTQGDVTAPNAPVAASPTSVTYNSFNANWAASTSIDETGYKLDVALDSTFDTILSSYRNLDVGNVLTWAITGLLSATTYYYRVRAYDATGNESVSSNVITLTTAQPPDITPPNVVTLQAPTSITSTTFTANWDEGVDDTGVVGYKIDLSQLDDFSFFIVENLDVGNTTSYGFTGLTPYSSYYYRVRAYDAAGNISSDTSEPELVSTHPSTIGDGGIVEVVYSPSGDTYTMQSDPSSNFGSEEVMSLSNVTGVKNRVVVQFDFADFTGELLNADLYLYLDSYAGLTFGTSVIRITRTSTSGWDETTLTYSNDTYTDSVEYIDIIPLATGWQTVDISSLLTQGAGVYSFSIQTTAASGAATFRTKEYASGEYGAYVELSYDPSVATQIDSLDVDVDHINITNLLKNPSAEIGGTAFGGTTGIIGLTSATLLQDTGGYAGTYCVKVTSAASIGSGVKFESDNTLAVANATAAVYRGSLYLYTSSNLNGLLTLQLKLTYTDATTTTGTATVIVTAANQWQRAEALATATSGKTVQKVELSLVQTDATARTFWADAAMVVKYPSTVPYFDGSSHVDTDWNGTAHASTSTWAGVLMASTLSYVGDADGDNSFEGRVALGGSLDQRYLAANQPTNNRGTKQATWTTEPFYKNNYLFNPTFTADLAYWTTVGSASQFERVTTKARGNVGDSDYACAGITLAASGGITSTRFIPSDPTTDAWTFSAYLAPNDNNAVTGVKLQIEEWSFSSLLATTEATVSTSASDGDFQRFSVTLPSASMNVGTKFVRVRILGSSAARLLIDDCQLEKQAVITPYSSGDKIDAAWEGLPNKSASYVRILHDSLYDIIYTVTDADGVVGANPYSSRVLTPSTPEDVITLDTLTLTPDTNLLDVVFTYLGDQNQSASFLLQWKRSDLNNWTNAIYSLNRSINTLYATIGGVRPGTSYDVRITATDTDDLVYGGVAVSANQAYLQQTIVTPVDTGNDGSSSTRVSFGGFILQSDSVSWVGVTEHDAYDFPDRDVQVEKVARTDGSIEVSRWWDKKSITMKGYIKADSRVELEDRLREFKRALAPHRQQLIVDTLDSKGYYWIATVESLSLPEEGGKNISHLEWTAKFVCADPFRYEATDTTENLINLSNGQSTQITNDGDLTLFPVFTLTTTSPTDINVTLMNVTTGERIYSLGAIKTGDRLIIDSSQLTVFKNDVKVDYEGTFPTLLSGPNTIKVTTSSGSVYLTVQRRHRYF